MRRETTVQLVALGCMAAFLAASGALAVQIAGSVGKNRLVYADKAEAGDPKAVSLGIAMGAFRGLFVNYLWIRANNLKEEGKYYEAVDLAKTITKLQPRFPKVWQFHAWNLAYNVSVTTQTPQERWNWVQAGIRLLRNEGVPNCPTDLGIQRELAWIHLHKVQGYMDDAHLYYKRQLALEWTYVLGSPPVLKLEDMGTGRVKRAYVDRWLKPIENAADSEEELFSAKPLAGETPEQAQQRAKEAPLLVAEIKARTGLDLDIRFLREYEILDATMRAAGMMDAKRAEGDQRSMLPPWVQDDPLARLISDPRFSAHTGKAVYNFARRKVLTRDYHMDPRLMIKYTERYGPLDWRHPAAHAVYWSQRGVEETLIRTSAENLKNFDVLNTDRITIQALQELFRSGDLTFDALYPEFYLGLPNTEFIDSYREALREFVARSKIETDRQRPYRFYWAGYQNFMLDAIRYLYRRGDIDAAKDYMEQLRLDPELNTNDRTLVEKLSKPVEQFVIDEVLDENRQTSPQVAQQEISGSLYAAYLGGLLRGNPKAFDAAFNYARLFHETYQQSRAFKTWVSEAAGQVGRMGFPPFEEYAAKIFAMLIRSAGWINGSIMYRNAPPDLQGSTYVFLEKLNLKEMMEAMSRQTGSPLFEQWFPPPPNVEFWRTKFHSALEELDRGRTEMK